MQFGFDCKTIIVTGGSFGIGRATAIAFAKEGANVVVADYIEDNETINEITNNGGNAIFVKCDVSNEDDVKNMVETTIQKFGRLDYAFNNAGIEGHSAPTHSCTNENWDRTLEINLKGVWLCMKYQIPEMLKQKSSAIVNCASIAGLVGFPGLPAYVASKHAVIGLTKSASLEYIKQGLRINAVCPGVIKTPMIDRVTGKDKVVEQAYADMKPIGRLGEPSEVASAVMYLCSDGASFITGQSLAVDGGWVTQ